MAFQYFYTLAYFYAYNNFFFFQFCHVLHGIKDCFLIYWFYMLRPPGGIRAIIAIVLDTFFSLSLSRDTYLYTAHTIYSLICSDRAHNLRIYNCNMLRANTFWHRWRLCIRRNEMQSEWICAYSVLYKLTINMHALLSLSLFRQ